MKRLAATVLSLALALMLVPVAALADPDPEEQGYAAPAAEEPAPAEKGRADIAKEMKDKSFEVLGTIPSMDPDDYVSNQAIVTVDLEQLGVDWLEPGQAAGLLIDGGSPLAGSTFEALPEDLRIDRSAQLLVTFPDGLGMADAVGALLDIPAVISAEPNYQGYFSTQAFVPDDPYDGGWAYDALNAGDAWGYAQCAGEVEIALISSGFDIDHEDLAANIDASRGWDAAHDISLTGCSDHCGVTCDYEYGTAHAGIISAVMDNDIGISGLSYDATIIPYSVGYWLNGQERFNNAGYIRALEKIKELIDNGDAPNLKVIAVCYSSPYILQSTDELIGTLGDSYGLEIVAAAGDSLAQDSNWPAEHGVVTGVTSIGSDYAYIPGHAYNGWNVHVCAPDSYYTTIPNDSYGYVQGTGCAAAAVAATAALMYASNQYMGSYGCVNILCSTAHDLGQEGADDYYGFGLVDMAEAVRYAKFSEFSDVDLAAWPVTEGWIPYAVENGIMTGYGGSATTFGPDNVMNRAMLLTALWRLATPGWESLPTEDNATGFTDIPDDAWYTAAYNWAWSNNVISHGNTQGKPTSAVARQEAAQFVRLAAGAMGANTSISGMGQPPYSDWDSVVYWAKDSVKWCYHKGVLTGSGPWFRPTNTLTRAQCAKVLTVLHRDVL